MLWLFFGLLFAAGYMGARRASNQAFLQRQVDVHYCPPPQTADEAMIEQALWVRGYDEAETEAEAGDESSEQASPAADEQPQGESFDGHGASGSW